MRSSSLFHKILFTLIFSMSFFCNISAANWDAIVPNLTSNDVSIIDLASPFPSVTTVPYLNPVSFGKSAITPDGTTAYITNNGSPASIIPYFFIGDMAKATQKGHFAKCSQNNILLERREFFMLLEGITPRRLQKRYKHD